MSELADKPVMLDLCCGAGGATAGYQRAGFSVVGVDIAEQPDYCGDKFIQGNAVSLMNELIAEYRPVFLHMSPPCQSFSTITPTHIRPGYPDLIPQFRMKAGLSAIPYVIENVMASPLRSDIMLCGEMFGLRVIRHRKFELGNGATVPQPEHIPHRGSTVGAGRKSRGTWVHGAPGGIDSANGAGFYYFGVYGNTHGKAHWQEAMGIDWTRDHHSIAEAIPPAYTEYIGLHVIDKVSEQGFIETILERRQSIALAIAERFTK